jgi:predicted RNA-binding Zn-ribbon protein involved in translation (DUF1610 family)
VSFQDNDPDRVQTPDRDETLLPSTQDSLPNKIVEVDSPKAGGPQTPVKVEMFCTACGAGLIKTAQLCPHCGSPAGTAAMVNHLPVSKYCPACGSGMVATAQVCMKCGTAVGQIKSKSTAILLAVFLGPWTYLYTYKRNAAKFWIGLVVGLFLGFLTVGISIFIVWLVAIIDVATKPESYYLHFPNTQ